MRRTALAVATTALAIFAIAAPAQAAAPAWRVMAAAGPTNLPPVNSEIQRLAVNSTGGTYTLSFGAGTTGPLAFDAGPAEVAAALNGLAGIGGTGGAVEVSGGPGALGGTIPYFIRFGGSLASTNVDQITANSAGLSGGTATATLTTTTGGGTNGTGRIVVYATNVGGAASNGTTVTMTLGSLPPGITVSGAVTGTGWTCTGDGPGAPPSLVGAQNVTCARTVAIPALRSAPTIGIPIEIGPGASPNPPPVPVTVSGGGALLPEEGNQFLMPVTVSSQQAGPGIQALWAEAFDADGRPVTGAGVHPHSAGSGFLLNTIIVPSGDFAPMGDVRDIDVELQPGFIGNPQVTPRCPRHQLATILVSAGCTPVSVVGNVVPIQQSFGGSATGNNMLFNDVPANGYAAQFTFPVATAQASIVGLLRSDGDYGVTVRAPNTPAFTKTYGAIGMLEGNPAGAAGKAFLTNPTNCAEQAQAAPLTTMVMNTWQQPTLFDSEQVPVPPVIDCDQLEFEAYDPEAETGEVDFDFQPSSTDAASVTAATAHLSIDQARLLDPVQSTTPHLKDSVVKLPEGLTPNPSVADGLQTCTTQQIGLKGTDFPMPNPIRFTKDSANCPDASKIGTATIETPLLDEPVEGVVYQAAQDDNPFKSLLALYIVVDNPKLGIVMKLPGRVDVDADTGQMTAVFENSPQAPFTDLTLNFRGGNRSVLATPDTCGPHATTGEWTPWSAPEWGPPAQTSSSFTLTKGPGGSAACPTTKAERPFSLGFEAGSTDPVAGKHSAFTVHLTRPDGNQELDKVSVTTPPGFAAKLKGVEICSWAAVDRAANRAKGAEEIADPSCPASSQVGTTTIGVGVGPSPFYVKTGKAYLTGPYTGAPLSLTFIVPAVAGPFDLGVQVVRTALRVNPVTAQVTAESDSIPPRLRGIPVLVRDIRVAIDRDSFTLNPTNCEPMTVTGKVTGGSGAVADLSSRFQVDQCNKLGFKPGLKLQLKGKTKRAEYQQLTATVTYPQKGAYSNIARTSVALPHSAFLAQEHIRTVCTRVQFAADNCPKGAIYGRAEAVSPLLDGKFKGPVYLRSSNNPLPDLVVALRGPDAQPIEVELAGRTDSVHGGIRNTFDFVPDAPVSWFRLKLFGGQKSLIINSRNLCKGKPQKATVRMTAHNGKRHNFRPVVGNSCKKKKKGKKNKSQGKKSRAKSSVAEPGRLVSLW